MTGVRFAHAMKLSLPLALLCVAWFTGLQAAGAADAAAPKPDADGFVPMFNGRDFTGWTNVNCAPETWSLRDGKIYCTGKPTGVLRTTRHYENFILEVEWRHLTEAGNSGVFVWGSDINPVGVHFLRGIEVQVLDVAYETNYEKKNGKKSTSFTSHGDVFAIQGATMKPIGRTNGRRGFPSEDRVKPSPEWNHYRITANNGSIRLAVNGKEVSGGDECSYRKGYLALESEGAPVEFRNVRIKELPPTPTAREFVAPIDPGWKCLFNGIDLRGWKTNAATAARWNVAEEKLALKPADAAAGDATLWTSAEFGNAEFVIDYQPAAGANDPRAEVKLRGSTLPLVAAEKGKFSRFILTARGGTLRVQREGGPSQEIALPANAPARGALGLVAGNAAGVFMNLHVRDL